MKVILTGGAGFIGSHVAEFYIKEGHQVLIIDDLSTGKEENIPQDSRFEKISILEYKKMEKIFEKFKPDIVNHHAAQSSVSVSTKNPLYDADVNIKGTIILLELSARYGCKGFIFAGSGGTAYGEPEVLPVKESCQGVPKSPYGVSKKSAEMYGMYYSEKIPFVSLRYGNVYGPRQDPFGEAGVIAIFSRRMLNNEEVFIYGDGTQTRDFIFIGDVVKANKKATEYVLKGNSGIFNIATGKETSVNEIFKKLKEITNYKKDPIYKPRREGEVYRISLDIEEAKEKLGFYPEVQIEEGLKKTVKYFYEKGE